MDFGRVLRRLLNRQAITIPRLRVARSGGPRGAVNCDGLRVRYLPVGVAVGGGCVGVGRGSQVVGVAVGGTGRLGLTVGTGRETWVGVAVGTRPGDAVGTGLGYWLGVSVGGTALGILLGLAAGDTLGVAGALGDAVGVGCSGV